MNLISFARMTIISFHSSYSIPNCAMNVAPRGTDEANTAYLPYSKR